MKNILVINTGSSSFKFQLIQMPTEKVLASGLVERIGQQNSEIHYSSQGYSGTREQQVPDHSIALRAVTDLLMSPDKGVIKDATEITAIGHRVVHGGTTFSKTTIIDKKVKKEIKALFSVAPLHNPPNLTGIEVAEEVFPNARQVAVFDTAFHSTIPAKAYKYAIPNHLTEENHIRLYGFHGTSHKYVSEKAAQSIKRTDSKIISVHLGNGCSITAVENGKSVDHSMGFTPLSGLIMGTRSGDLDPSIIFHLVDKLGYSLKEVNELLTKKSGMLGLTGYSDLRDIETEAQKGNRECKLALEMNAYRIKKYIGSYIAAMNGLDILVFTAGIGENSGTMRKLVCNNMDFIGIELDEIQNNLRSKESRVISTETSKVKVMVIPTNEELEIARQVDKLV
ncbi:acetate kinase [Salegentibacter sp. F188]|uniref:Acetate kinase n=1 Tax=Autumnicola patrickiae TaxID=3075591 RepID=A0ABU3E3X7_9FLAO|nr:acetate kinase [Salegentibacter sp. F188]MDT0690610.1 acetate kinase [Salegentibacter sp. F188]